jgi:hypothetical protein
VVPEVSAVYTSSVAGRIALLEAKISALQAEIDEIVNDVNNKV